MNTSSTIPDKTSSGGTPASRLRMLFVDDESAVLHILKIGMQPLAAEWDMHFVDSGKKALALIQQQPFDVVVSDMRMSDMNGAQLLNHVLQEHPRTARIILSGYSDLQDVIRCLGLAHQFLHKPCDIVEFRNNLKRIASLNLQLHQDRLLTLAGRLTKVPSIPDLYLEMLDALQSPTSSTQRIADIASQDPALSAKLLQISNSAFFGFNRTFSSVDEAVQFLGVGVIQSLALAVPLFNAFDQNKCPKFPVDHVWNHSVHTGMLARRFINEYLEDFELAEQAFTAGVLHDIGQIILADNLPDEYMAVLADAHLRSEPLCQAERRNFQTTHAEVGGYLLALWGLPFPLVDAVAYHHEPRKSQVTTFGLTGVIHIVSALQHERAAHPAVVSNPVDLDYVHGIGMADHLEKWRHDLFNVDDEINGKKPRVHEPASRHCA